jgi:cardiolipin synthase
LGATDFVDGLMARREGPTKLGSLIDPVADKIFVASIMLSMVAVNLFPAWLISILLCREFLMTALRSSVAYRKEVFKTSRLAKLKTIIQMGGCGTIFFTIILGKFAFIYVCLLLAIPFFLVAIAYRVKKQTAPFWALPVGLAFTLVSLIQFLFTKEITLLVQILIIIGITWASALDYLFSSFRLFRRTGMVMEDWVRVVWAFVYGLLVALLVGFYPIIVLPILISMSLEFGIGGIDNIVVAQKNKFLIWPFLITSSVGIFFVSCMSLALYLGWKLPYFYGALILPMASSIVCGLFFGLNTDLFRRIPSGSKSSL